VASFIVLFKEVNVNYTGIECHFCHSQSLDVGFPRQGTSGNTEVRSCKCYYCGAEYDRVTYLPDPIIIPTKLPGGNDQNVWTIQYGKTPNWDKAPVICTVHTNDQELVDKVARTIVVVMGDNTRECRYFKGTNPNVSGFYVHMRNIDSRIYSAILNKVYQGELWGDNDE
jgi:hypothetical protein